MKVKEWIKENWILVGIVALSLVIRIYYFVLTNGQALWWDEAEYMNIAKRFAFSWDYNFGPVRPILFSLITSLFLRVSDTEFLPRIMILFFSVAFVMGVYYLGKEACNKTTGAISAFLFSTFYIGLFYAYRLLVDLPATALFIFSALFFYKYIKEKKPKFLYLTTVLVGIGTLFKLSTAFIILPFLIYIIFTEKFTFIKERIGKEIIISVGIFVIILLPYVLWGYDEFGSFVLSAASSHVAPTNYIGNLFSNLKMYFSLFSSATSTPFIILTLLSLLLMYRPLLYFGKIREGNWELRGEFYLILLLVLPLLLISTMVNHAEDRYILAVFPILFLILGAGLTRFYNGLKGGSFQYSKIIAVLLLVSIIIFISVTQVRYSDALIKNKVSSYADIKSAGLWLKNNSNASDIIATKSQPQIRYYSERKTIGLPQTEEEFKMSLTPDVKFYIVSVFETHQQWQYDYAKKNNLTLVQAHILPDGRPVLIVYNLK